MECEDDLENHIQTFIDLCEREKIKDKKEEFLFILNFIIKISDNHYRNRGFFEKIEKILLYFKDTIKETFSNLEFYKKCQNNKRILLFLYKEKIIEFNEEIIHNIKNDYLTDDKYNLFYFIPELKDFEDEKKIQRMSKQLLKIDSIDLEDYEEKRKIGENSSYLCEMIRFDLVEEFIQYVSQKSIKLSEKVSPSMFESNSFLLKKKEIRLIEYAAFFGSIQIFQYLRMNGVEIDSSIWLFAIHSNNDEMIQIIESLDLKPNFEDCLRESIICHHNNVAQYICDNHWNKNFKNIEEDIYENYNFFFFPDDIIKFISEANNKAFGIKCYCSLFSKITIPTSVETIGNGVFMGCSTLKEIIIPSSVTSIGKGSFNGCTSLEKILIPSSVTSIGNAAFKECTSLKEILIPSSITSIESCFAKGCKSLEKISIPSSVTSINNFAFADCYSLSQIIIPSSVKSIGNYAFSNCKSLIEIDIPLSTDFIGPFAFEGCVNLKKLLLPFHITNIENFGIDKEKIILKK